MQLDSVTIATGIPRFDCHISLYWLKMHTSDNFLDMPDDGINPFMFSNHHEMGAWRGRALFTLVYHCDVIARA